MTGRRRVSIPALWVTFAAGMVAFTVAFERGLPALMTYLHRVPAAVGLAGPGALFVTDWTGGRNFAPMFDGLAEATRDSDLLIGFLGDSTVGGVGRDRDIPRWTQLALGPRVRGRRVHMMDFSAIGQFAPDALVLAAKALSVEPDLLVYSVTPRVIPVEPDLPWATGAGDLALQADVVRQMGLGHALWLLGFARAPRSAVYSWWAPARFRTIAAGLIEAELPGRVSPLAAMLLGLVLTKAPAPVAGTNVAPGMHQWAPSAYAPEPLTRTSQALVWLFEMCGRHGRCLIYHGPINPAARERFTPALVEPFWTWLSAEAARTGVPLIDHRDALPAARFRAIGALLDPIHPDDDGWREMGTIVADDVARRLAELDR